MSYHHFDMDDDCPRLPSYADLYTDMDWQVMLADLSDVELAQCYEASLDETGPVPLYLVTYEMQARGYTFDELEGLLDHQYA